MSILTPAYPSNNQRFSEAVNQMCRAVGHPQRPSIKYIFGTSPTVGYARENVYVRNATDLATYFNAHQDANGTTVINSEMQIFMSFTDTGVFVFNSDHLAITAYNPYPANSFDVLKSGQFTTNQAVTGVIPLSSTDMTTTAGITVNQICYIAGRGAFLVTAVTLDTDFTLTAITGSLTTAAANGIQIIFPPIYRMVTNNSVPAGQASIITTGVHASVAVGMQVRWQNGDYIGANGEATITAINGNTLTLSGPVWTNQTIPISGVIWALPALRSGQFWLKNYYAPTFDQRSVIASRLTFTQPGNGLHRYTDYTSVGALNAQAAMGAFPAYWNFSASDGGLGTDTSEIDVLEQENSRTVDMTAWFGGIGGKQAPVTFYENNGAGGTWTNGFHYYTSKDLSVGQHQMGHIWTPMTSHQYVDDVQLRAREFRWGAGRRAQFGVDLAVGVMQGGLAQNFTFPVKATNFDYMNMKIYSLEYWLL